MLLGLLKVGKNTFVVTVEVNYLACVETTTPKHRIFCFCTRKTCSVTTLATDIQTV
jgi:hypothetical protein